MPTFHHGQRRVIYPIPGNLARVSLEGFLELLKINPNTRLFFKLRFARQDKIHIEMENGRFLILPYGWGVVEATGNMLGQPIKEILSSKGFLMNITKGNIHLYTEDVSESAPTVTGSVIVNAAATDLNITQINNSTPANFNITQVVTEVVDLLAVAPEVVSTNEVNSTESIDTNTDISTEDTNTVVEENSDDTQENTNTNTPDVSVIEVDNTVSNTDS